MVGIGDEDDFVFYIPVAVLSEALAHLASSLENSEFTIQNCERDRVATYYLGDLTFQIPIYAKTKRFFSRGTVEGFTVETDQEIRLVPFVDLETVTSGIWCRQSNIDMPSERYAIRGGRDFELCQTEVKISLASSFARVVLCIWGGQHSGDLEKDENFRKVIGPLKAMSTFCVFEGSYGLVSIKPPLGEVSSDAGEVYGDMGSIDDIENVMSAWLSMDHQK